MKTMIVAIGCDHAGLPLKQRAINEIEAGGHTVVDCGVQDDRPADYPDIARAVGQRLLDRTAERAVIICGSGVGVAMAANKLPGIRAGLCHDCYSARQAVEHDALNVLCLGSRVIGPELAAELIRTFLQTRFSGHPRHVRRLHKVAELETQARTGAFGEGPSWEPETGQ